MTTPRPDSRLGTDLGPYRIERVLGRGGMGVVYLAEQRELGRKVALKLLAPDFADDEAFRARFLRESHLAASIDHANIIPIYEAGEADGTYYLAMRYVEGTDLDDRLKAGPLDPALTIALLAQVAGALDAAHARASSIATSSPPTCSWPTRAARSPHVYLTDFGLTKKRASQSGPDARGLDPWHARVHGARAGRGRRGRRPGRRVRPGLCRLPVPDGPGALRARFGRRGRHGPPA